MLFALSYLPACGGSDGDDAPSPLALVVTVEGQGQIVSSPRGLDCFDACTQTLSGTGPVALLAVPMRGWAFVAWQGDACANQGTPLCELPADGRALEVKAGFAPAPLGLAEAAWREGELHTHSDHSSDGSLLRQALDDRAPGNMPLKDIIALSETLGLDFLPITDHRSYDQHYDPQWQSARVLLIPGEEANGRPHATVHGAVDMIDQNASIEGAPDSRIVEESIWLAHSQDAVWITAHPDDGEINDDGSLNARADAVGVDLVEIWNRASNPEREIDYAENRWNAGYRFGIAGASDNHFKELWAGGGTPGRPRTEILSPQLGERAVLDALRAGHTNVFSRDAASPRVRLDADFDGDGVYEVQAGDEIFVPAGTPGQLRIRIGQAYGSRVLVYAAPGRSARPIANVTAPGLTAGGELLVDVLAAETPGWYRAEVRSLGLAEPASLLMGLMLGPHDPQNLFQELLDQLRAVTSPIFVSSAPVETQGAFLPPPDAGLADDAEYALGAPGEFAGFADAAFDTVSSRLHVVAEVHDSLSTRIEYTSRAADGRWRRPRFLTDSTSARFPKLSAAGDTVAVAWQDERAGQLPRRPAIYLRLSRNGGASFGPEILVRALDGSAMHPDLALATDGSVHLVWQEIRSGEPFDIGYARVDAAARVSTARALSRDGKTIQAPGPLDARSARYPASVWPAIALDGTIPLVVWQDNRFDPDPLWTGQASSGEGSDPDDWQIAFLRLDGAAPVPEYLGAADAADRHPDVLVDAAGRVHIAWDSKPLRSSGANLRVLATVREAGALRFGEPGSVAWQPASSARQPRLGLGADGRAQLAWFDSRSADWRWRVMSTVFDGTHWADPRLLLSRGVGSWPVPAGPYLIFSSTRNARRLQRDRSQQIYVVAREAPATVAATLRAAALAAKSLRLAPASTEAEQDCARKWPRQAPPQLPLRWNLTDEPS